MATMTELRDRIAAELDRDDMGAGGALETLLDMAIEQAVALHADQLFWFNLESSSVVAAAGNASVALPAGLRSALVVSCEGQALRKRRLAIPGETSGRPLFWADRDGTILLSPIPDAAYSLDLLGIAELGLPAADESNGWTEEAADLIVETAKKSLCRGALRDAEGAAMAAIGEQEQLARLRRETRRRGALPQTSDLPHGAPFDIVRG
jgi:hypothetical protein